VVFDESVFPFSTTPTTTHVPDPSSLFPADTLPGTCPGSPAGPGPSSSGAAPISPSGADPGTSLPDTAPGGRRLVLPWHLLRGTQRRYGYTSAGRGRRHSRSLLRRGHRHHHLSPCRPVTHRRSTTRRFFIDTRGMFT
jgi:hypothetical protein